MDRIAPTLRPAGPPQGYQKWRSLLFLHWEVPVDVLRALIPKSLEIDTFEGRAYAGVVPFTMLDVRPSWCPPVPGVSDFHELNVRTYVHHEGDNPGVWFFSLDAARTLPVLAARVGWGLPYHRATMELVQHGDHVRYRSARHFPDPTPANFAAEYDVGEPLGPSEPGSFQHFLAERYYLYAVRRGRLVRGQVHHSAYPLHRARVASWSESMLAAAGLPAGDGPPHALYSPGVDVEVFALEPVPAT